MKHLLNRLFTNDSEPLPADGAGALAEQSQVQSLRLELAQRDATIHNLQAEVERLRSRQDRLVEETLRARLEGLFAALAGPAVQLRTQDYLEAQGKPLQAGDVLAVARRLARGLERGGLTMEDAPGDCVPFDPLRHTPLDRNAAIQSAQPVVVRFAGASYEGKILVKAIVEPGGPCQDV